MNINESLRLIAVTALLLGWVLPASGFGESDGISDVSGVFQITGASANASVNTTGQASQDAYQEQNEKTNKILEQPGATDRFTSELAQGECGAMMGSLAEANGLDSDSGKEAFCSLMSSNSDTFLDEDADHTAQGVADNITATLVRHMTETLSGNINPEVPPSDLDNEPLDQFGDVDEQPIPDDDLDCQTVDPSDEWYQHNC